ncbi:hypothetical protein BGAFAR04_E0025 (plasmid) [Borreliella garinii Far04]|nr:hypothetical protein BGAFAR04_E0025 [Borreliella garinii Far04]
MGKINIINNKNNIAKNCLGFKIIRGITLKTLILNKYVI